MPDLQYRYLCDVGDMVGFGMKLQGVSSGLSGLIANGPLEQTALLARSFQYAPRIASHALSAQQQPIIRTYA